MPKDENVDVDGVQVRSELTPDGRFELPDPTPMAPPIGYKAEPTLSDMIRSMVRREQFNLEVSRAGFETFDEAEDFDIEDDPVDPLTPYERVFEPPPAKPLVQEPVAPERASSDPKPAESGPKADVTAAPAAPIASTPT